VHRVVVTLDVFASEPLYRQLASQFRKCIDDGRLAPGARLPSIRELSRQLQISLITVREAMEVLSEEGLVQPRHGSGTYVSPDAGKSTAEATNEELRFSTPTFIGQFTELCTDFPWSKEALSLDAACNQRPFDPWWSASLPFDFRSVGDAGKIVHRGGWEKAVRASLNGMSEPSKYCDARGLPELRREIAGWLKRTRGINCDADDVFITCGAQQCRDLAAKLLASPGRTVVLEEPASITDVLAYEVQRAEIMFVPQDEDGVDVDMLEPVQEAGVAHLITTGNFPTGARLSTDRAERVVAWAQKNDVFLVEDAYGGGYEFDGKPEPPLYAAARKARATERIIYHGSFTHLVSSSLRLGFAVVPRGLQKTYMRLKWLTDRHAPILSQQLLLNLFISGAFDEQQLRVVQTARNQRKALLDELNQWPDGLIRYTPSQAGFQQAVWFTQPVDDILVFERAMKAGIGIIPLSPYYQASEPQPGLCLNFMRLEEQQIKAGLRKLRGIVQECCLVNVPE
jgi:GntR family transcriptional regulator / MocR family aminotransferase